MEETYVVDKDFMAWFRDHLGIPNKAIGALFHADDWTTIIVMHSITESMLGTMIAAKLGHPNLEPVIGRLNFAGRTGLLTWCAKLDLLSENQLRFLGFMGDARNQVAHKIRNFEFTFEAWTNNLEKTELGNFNKLAGTISAELANKSEDGTKYILRTNPRTVIIATFWFILANARKTIDSLQRQSTPKEESQ
jgi:hypothetical protein